MSVMVLGQRTCDCGCGASMEGRHPRARYVDGKHKAAHWKERTGYGRADRAENRSYAPRAGGNRSGRQISYRKAVNHLTLYLMLGTGLSEHAAKEIASEILGPCLPEAQRA